MGVVGTSRDFGLASIIAAGGLSKSVCVAGNALTPAYAPA